MATIANLNVKLTAGLAASFAATMSKGKAMVDGLAGSVSGAAGKIAGWGGALAAVATGGGLAVLVKTQADAIDNVAKLSDRLGIQTEKLVGLQHAADLAGVSDEQLTGGLEKMLKSLGGAADEGGKASDAFASLGLDARELAGLPMDQAFTRIAEKIGGIQNPTERAAVAMQIFGKSGQSLLPLLMSGADGIAAAQAEAQRLGLTFSRLDAAKVEAANDALTVAGGVMAGVGRTLAIQLAPYVAALAGQFTEAATSGKGMGDRVVGVFEGIVGGVARAADYLDLVVSGWHFMRGVAGSALLAVLAPLNLVIQGVDWLVNKLTGSGTAFAGFSQGMIDGLASETQEAFAKSGEAMDRFASGERSAAVAAYFAKLRAGAADSAKAIADQAAKMNAGALAAEAYAAKLKESADNARKVSDTIADLRKQVDQAGMSEAQKKAADLKALGATPQEMTQAIDLLNTIERQKATDALAQRAQQLVDSMRTPLEEYNHKLSELQEMFGKGLLTDGEFARAAEMAQQQLAGAGGGPATPADALTAGSAAAQRFQYEQSRGVAALGNRDDIAKQQLASQRNAEGALEEIARNTARGAGGASLSLWDSI